MSVDSDNIMRLHENAKMINSKVETLTEKLQRLESTIAILQSELVQNKQLVIHLMTKGTGSTV